LPDSTLPDPNLPSHIEETVQTIARLHADHHRSATPAQRGVARITGLLGCPGFLAALTLLVAGWIGFNLLAGTLGYPAPDPPPFPWLEGAVSLASLYMVVLILATQRREDELIQHRDQLILELALVSEQKTTKVIQLLEESRRDNPLMENRVDREAEAMAQPADPQSVLDEIKKTRAIAEKTEAPAKGAAR